MISPELGFSSPTNVRSKVLLPDPEPPRITMVSPRITSKLTPCKISRVAVTDAQIAQRNHRLREEIVVIEVVDYGFITAPTRL